MSTQTKKLVDIFEALPQDERGLLMSIAVKFISRYDDDVLTEEDLADIREAESEYAGGGYVELEDFKARLNN